MQYQLLRFATVVSVASTCAVAWVMTVGSGIAGAARTRSGAVHAQLVASTNHVSPTGNTSSGLGLTGPTVMFSVVALMAVLALAFLVVTFIRRRTSLA